MAKCDYCGTTILFGGKEDGSYKFCNDECLEGGQVLKVADQIHEDTVYEATLQAHQDNCPKCNGPGPVDVQTSYSVWSAIVMSSYKSSPEVCCGSCGTKKKLGATLFSLVFGWWGFPWGILMTPVQVVRNLISLGKRPQRGRPSEELANMVRMNLAAHILEQAQLQADHLEEEDRARAGV